MCLMTVSEKNRVARPEKQATLVIPAIDPKAVEAQTKDIPILGEIPHPPRGIRRLQHPPKRTSFFGCDQEGF